MVISEKSETILKKPIASEGEYADKFLSQGWRFYSIPWTNRSFFTDLHLEKHDDQIHILSIGTDDWGNIRASVIANDKGLKFLKGMFG